MAPTKSRNPTSESIRALIDQLVEVLGGCDDRARHEGVGWLCDVQTWLAATLHYIVATFLFPRTHAYGRFGPTGWVDSLHEMHGCNNFVRTRVVRRSHSSLFP